LNDLVTQAQAAQLGALYEEYLLAPCKSKEELNQWIQTFLNISFPNYTLDENSTSNPLDFIWDVYSAALSGDNNRTSFVGAASRAGMKTLSVSVLEFLLMLHLGKTIVHLSAILDQSMACIGYLDNFLALPAIKKFSKTDSQRKKILRGMPENEFRSSLPASLKVLVATQESANGMRGNIICMDEVDLINPGVISEAAMIADPDQLGRPPIFIYISSRKSAFGPVQDKIDESSNPESGIKLHKWSLADFMQRCAPEVHRPDEPRPTVYIHRDSLEIKSEVDYKIIPTTMQAGYDAREVYAGCVSCPALLVCQGRAVDQKSQPSRALRDITFVKSVLRETKDPEKIKAQLLNLKPESSGNVFNRFERSKHTGPIERAWEFAFGVPWEHEAKLTKRYFREALTANGWYVTCGVDFGYVDPAVSTLVAHHRGFDRLIILHTVKASGFSNPDWLGFTRERVYLPFGFDLLCPDTADKSSPSTAAKLGMQARSRKPHRIEAGISWLQNHIWSATKQASSLFVIDDEFNQPMIKSLERYQYKRGALGFVFDTFDPDSEWSHEIDALRYACDPWVVYTSTNLDGNQVKKASQLPLHFEHEKAKAEALAVEKKYLMGEIRQHYADEYNLTLDIPEEPSDNGAEGTHSLYFSF
jgi:hypothetical protein